MEALYAPPNHPVFELVPPLFHERVSQLYMATGEPEVTITTFWDIYLDLLKQLRDGRDEQLSHVLDSHKETLNRNLEDMPLLPGMDAFRLGQPLQPGRRGCYIGGLDDISIERALSKFGVEYAEFTTDEEGEGEDNGEGDNSG